MIVERHHSLTKESQYKTTNQLILEAAAFLFWQKGFEATRCDEIAQLARLTKGAVYYHFKSKAELGEKLLDCAEERWLGGIEGELSQTHNTPVDLIQKVLKKEKQLFQDPIIRGGLTLLTLSTKVEQESGLNKRARAFWEARNEFYQKLFNQADRTTGPIFSYALAGFLTQALYERDVQIYLEGVNLLRTGCLKMAALVKTDRVWSLRYEN